MAFRDENKRWRCPSDRQLALRAKVHSGWSVHSDDVFRRVQPIPTSEMQSIENVIEKAKQIELLEMERIGRMVYRLENMSRNALGDGKRTCSMCGVAFGLFRTSIIYCFDCSKAVCEKCRVDTPSSSPEVCMLCKICAENREVWKKSGGWFYGKLPTVTEIRPEVQKVQVMGSPVPARAFDTWEHRAPDIVRMESFEPPEENSNEHSLYRSWALGSSSEIDSAEGDVVVKRPKLRRKSSEDIVLPMRNSSNLLDIQSQKISMSCPALKELQVDEAERKSRSFSRRKILTPAKKMMAKFTRHKTKT